MINKAGYWFEPEEPGDVARELHRGENEPTDNRRFKTGGLEPPVTVVTGPVRRVWNGLLNGRDTMDLTAAPAW